MILLNKTTKSENDQDKAPSLLLPTSIVTLLLVLLSLSTVTIPTTRTTTSDVTMYLLSFTGNARDVKESDLKKNPTIQSTLKSIQFEHLKIEDRYKTFWHSFTTVLCKNLHWNFQLAGYNR